VTVPVPAGTSARGPPGLPLAVQVSGMLRLPVSPAALEQRQLEAHHAHNGDRGGETAFASDRLNALCVYGCMQGESSVLVIAAQEVMTGIVFRRFSYPGQT
jgi:hypothetical protein